MIAPSCIARAVFIQQGVFAQQHLNVVEAKSITLRYTTAMPKTVHKNAGVTVIAAVILRKAAMIPTAMLIMRAAVVQVLLHEQSDVDI